MLSFSFFLDATISNLKNSGCDYCIKYHHSLGAAVDYKVSWHKAFTSRETDDDMSILKPGEDAVQ